MSKWRVFALVLVFLCHVVWHPQLVGAVDLSAFFAFGPENGDNSVAPGDDTSGIIELKTPVNFFCTLYNQIYINVNGLVSFDAPISTFTPTCGPTNTPLIAPFWADIDIRLTGNITYRETTERNYLDRIANLARQVLGIVWAPRSLFIITWANVTFFGSCVTPIESSPVNTFQVVLASDGRISTSYFLYNQITWTAGTASGGDCNTGLGGAPAETAFDPGNSTTYFPASDDSCTAGMLNLPTDTARLVPGELFFRIDSVFQKGTFYPKPGHDHGHHHHNCSHEAWNSTNRCWPTTETEATDSNAMSGNATEAKRKGLVRIPLTRLSPRSTNVPLFYYQNSAYTGLVLIGTPPQPFWLKLDTGSADLWVFSSDCTTPGCVDLADKYDQSASSTYYPDGTPFTTTSTSGYTLTGAEIFDTVTIGGLSIYWQAFAQITEESGFPSMAFFDGVLGLAYSALSVNKELTLLDMLYNSGLLYPYVFSLYLENIPLAKSSPPLGELILGGVDDSKYWGCITYTPLVEPFAKYTIDLVGVSFVTPDKRTRVCTSDCQAVIDSGSNVLLYPQTAFQTLVNMTGAILSSSTNLYTVPCADVANLPTLSFNIDAKFYPLIGSQYIYYAPDGCALLVSSSGSEDPLLTLGVPFMQAYYTVFDVTNAQLGLAVSIPGVQIASP